jgi:hypothetical protein
MRIFHDKGLWLAQIPTSYGAIELLCGEGDSPDIKNILLIEQFFDGSSDYLREIRSSAFRVPFLWRPIRLAVNSEGRLGVQFQHRLTGRQEGMFIADQHSSFSTRLSQVAVSEEDMRRLEAHGADGEESH